MATVFEAQALTKCYRRRTVLDNLHLSIPQGSVYGLVGENGAGKTTLIRLMAGLDFPTSGDFSLFEKAENQVEQRRRMGFLIESPALYPDMTARQNLELVRIQRGIPEKNQVDELLERLFLQDTGRQRVKNFSLGMRQRLGIAVALLNEPEFLVLDEPINGLDPTGILEIRRLLQELNQQKGTTILISSHILPELESLATRYGFLHHGRLVQDISAGELGERCRQYILLRVPDPERAAAMLESELHTAKFAVYPDRSLHIYDLMGRTVEISACLAHHQIPVQELTTKGDDLETYFQRLIGGGAE